MITLIDKFSSYALYNILCVYNNFILRVFLISKFKISIQPFKVFFILKYVWWPNFIFCEILFLFFLGIKNTLIWFYNTQKNKKNSKNIKFDLQVYFNMENTLNCWVDILKSEMRYTMRSKKNISYLATNNNITRSVYILNAETFFEGL
jgi:hypothetical protein